MKSFAGLAYLIAYIVVKGKFNQQPDGSHNYLGGKIQLHSRIKLMLTMVVNDSQIDWIKFCLLTVLISMTPLALVSSMSPLAACPLFQLIL